MPPLTPHAYLAGPDVFFPNAKALGAEKIAKLAAVGIEGHFPLDNELPKSAPLTPQKTAALIAEGNERMMLDCCKEGRFGMIFVNMTPYHGPSMDIGAGFETGFMSALAETKDNVLIIGYTDDPRSFEERVIEAIYGGKRNLETRNGLLYAPDGKMIEAFGLAENLMIVHAIEKTGGAILSSFDAAVAFAQKRLLLKREEVGYVNNGASL